MGLKDLADDKKPREKAMIFGVEKLTDAELLAIILSTGSKKYDVLEISHQLLKKYLTLKNIVNLSLDELSSNYGIKKVKALKLLIVSELIKRIEFENNQQDYYNELCLIGMRFKNLLCDSYKEKLALILLSKNYKLIYESILSVGNEEQVIISPKEIISMALKYDSKKIYIAHNHPSNVYFPSQGDIMQTKNLLTMCKYMGIELIDHLIIVHSGYYSITNQKYYKYEK